MSERFKLISAPGRNLYSSYELSKENRDNIDQSCSCHYPLHFQVQNATQYAYLHKSVASFIKSYNLTNKEVNHEYEYLFEDPERDDGNYQEYYSKWSMIDNCLKQDCINHYYNRVDLVHYNGNANKKALFSLHFLHCVMAIQRLKLHLRREHPFYIGNNVERSTLAARTRMMNRVVIATIRDLKRHCLLILCLGEHPYAYAERV